MLAEPTPVPQCVLAPPVGRPRVSPCTLTRLRGSSITGRHSVRCHGDMPRCSAPPLAFRATSNDSEVVPPYVVVSSEGQVEVWSGYQLQFKGMRRHNWQDDLAQELRSALGRLPISAGAALSGMYMTTDPRACDVQNRLFTNPLDAMPRRVVGMRFERGLGPMPEPPEPVQLVGGYLPLLPVQSWRSVGVVAGSRNRGAMGARTPPGER